jgi:ferredoxin-fold anticodon binding domain-containing protein
MTYKLKIDIGRYKVGDLVNVEFEDKIITLDKFSVLKFKINNVRYGTALENTKDVKEKLMQKLFNNVFDAI